MPYTPTVWVDEIPDSTPVKYKISQTTDGDVATDATIEAITPITAGTPLNAANLNKLEAALELAMETIETIDAYVTSFIQVSMPCKIGGIYITTVNENPAITYGYGTWIAFGAGRVLVGAGTSDATYAAAATGGESNHTLISSEMPSHTHVQNSHNHTFGEDGKWFAPWVSGDSEYNIRTNGSHVNTGAAAIATNQNTGGGGAHNNMPPYVVVYFWKRTA